MKILWFIKSTLRKLIIRKLIFSGYSSYFAPIVYRRRNEDLFKNKKTTISQKIWAQKRGFFSDSISFYGLTDGNYSEYLSDFDYYRLHPINGPYSKWIDDKLTLRYILQPFAEYLPEYYYHIHNNEILRLSDCPEGFGQTIQDVINLLKEKRHLAAKLVSGSLGKGFYKLAFDGQDFFINNNISPEEEVRELIITWKQTENVGYLITEYLQASKDLRKIWSESPNTMRIMVIRERDQIPRIVLSYIEFGLESSGVIESVNGIYCQVDQVTGCFSDGKIDAGDKVLDCRYHPDSLVLCEGVIPHWSQVTDKIIEISSYLPQVRYMGFDVVITDDGFKIIEINSLQGIMMIQYFYPLLSNEMSKEFFNMLIKEKKAGCKNL